MTCHVTKPSIKKILLPLKNRAIHRKIFVILNILFKIFILSFFPTTVRNKAHLSSISTFQKKYILCLNLQNKINDKICLINIEI